MGRDLYASQPVFRDALDRCAAIFDTLLNRSLLELLFAEEGSADAELLNQTGYTQPALFAFEYALSELWQSWGIRPDIVLGHSVGEIGAMCVAGGVSLEDGLKLIAARGRLMQALPAGGVMTSVMADEGRVLQAIAGAEDVVAIAAINAPGQVVISGAGTAVAEIEARLTADGIKTKSLTVSHAFHSPLMRPMLADYERVVREIRFSPPRVPFVSCVDGVLAGDEVTRTEYWLRNVMEPVRFAAGVKTLEAQQVTAYVEIGPHPVLLGMTRQCVSDEGAAAWLPSLRKDAGAWPTIGASVAALYARGADIDWKGFDRPYVRTRVSVPTYPFARKDYWLRNLPAPVHGGSVSRSPSTDEQVRDGNAARYELVWRPASSSSPATDRSRQLRHWVIVADRGGVGADLAARLSAQVARTTLLATGDVELAPVWNSVSPADPHYVCCVVDLSALDVAPADVSSAPDLVTSAVQLTQATARAPMPAMVWIVTRAAAGPAAGDGVALPAAPLWGLGRTIALEQPERWGGLIDVSFDTTAAAAQALAAELLNGDGEDQVSLTAAGRHVARVARTAETAAEPVALSPDGSYLVTGGVGALGLHAARWLVDNGARRLILASRGGVLTDRAKAAVAMLEGRGASITVVSADVSQPPDLDRLLAAIGPTSPLRGVVHAAGVDTTVTLEAMTPADVRAALAGKAIGAWLLHERTRTLDLDLFVCFSSMSAVLGAQGRAHYGAANAFLDALVTERRRLGLAGTSINWGPWTGGGMASPEDLQQFSRIGNRGLDPDDALRILSAVIARGDAQTMVADIDWETFRPIYEARRPRPILVEVTARGPQPAVAGAPPAAAPWIARLQAIAPAERLPQLTILLRHEVADTLGFDGPDSVPLEKSFYDLGMDSLMMADLVGRLKSRVGVSCTGLVFNHPKVHDLAEQMLARLPVEAGERTPTADPSSGVGAAPGASSGPRPDSYDPTAEADILAFQARAFPDRRADWVESRWRWMFLESAARLRVKPQFWLHRDEGAIVAQMGSIPVRLKVGEDYLDTGWLVETMVLPEYRSQALGSRLMIEAHDDQPFSLSLGQTQEMREIQFRLGWKQVAPLQTAQLLVRAGNVLKGKVPLPAAWAADLGLRASSALRNVVADRRTLRATEVERFDTRHDGLWNAAARDLQCAVVRDASYLNWKYVDQPGQEFLRLELSDEGGVKGITVWAFREPDEHYRYRRALLIDLVAPMSDQSTLQQIIKSSCAVVQERGADALLCHHVGDRLTQALRTCGFHLRKPERFLLVDPGDLSGPALDRVLSADSWFVTHGDSDIDRPW